MILRGRRSNPCRGYARLPAPQYDESSYFLTRYFCIRLPGHSGLANPRNTNASHPREDCGAASWDGHRILHVSCTGVSGSVVLGSRSAGAWRDFACVSAVAHDASAHGCVHRGGHGKALARLLPCLHRSRVYSICGEGLDRTVCFHSTDRCALLSARLRNDCALANQYGAAVLSTISCSCRLRELLPLFLDWLRGWS